MKSRSLLAVALVTFSVLPTWAHEGPGGPGSHWHATDVLGFIAATVAVGAMLWWHGRK
jgi:hypothetical protein